MHRDSWFRGDSFDVRRMISAPGEGGSEIGAFKVPAD